MSRIIMLIPLEKNIGLNTVSLSLIHFFKKNKFNNASYKSILYISCINDLLDDTSLIINKYFSKSVSTLNNIDFSDIFFNSYEYFSLLNKIIEICYDKKFFHQLILIKGLGEDYNFNAEKINYDISQNLSAEVIFISNLKNSSLKNVKKKEEHINLFLDQKKYKNVLGVIFNKINSPFLEKKYNFIEKLKFLKKIKENRKELFSIEKKFKKKCFSIIACIPWSLKIVQIYLSDIYFFLNLKSLFLMTKRKCVIKEIIIFDNNFINMENKIDSNTLIIVSFTRLNLFLDILKLNVSSNKISSIILTEVLESKNFTFSLSDLLILSHVSIFYTKKNTLDILSELQNFNFDLRVKNIIDIKNIQKYISSFFSCSSLFFKKEKICAHHIKFSPKEFCYHLKMVSSKNNKRIILPESYEIRILQAVSVCQNHNIAHCVLLGDPEKIYHIANKQGINLTKKIEIINPFLIRDKYVARFLEIRKKKGINELCAKKQLEKNIFLATLMLESNEVDGLVSGASSTTADTIRPALQIIKTNPGNLLVSSIFFMLFPNQVMIYGDCAINVDPTAEELAEIAIQSADSAQIFGIEPRLAMLSYSTGYSGCGSQVEKVRHATSLVKIRRPDLMIDGPVQYDAAVSEEIAKLKMPSSLTLGNANIFIFPDLNSGNIAYKAVQRSANILSIGPMLQGLRKPVNDLSRGATVEEIIHTIALTAIQSS